MGIDIGNPWFLLLLLVLPGTVFLSYRSLAGLGRTRRITALTLRLLILALLIFALAETQTLRTNEDLAVLFLLDQSESVIPSLRAQALQFVNRAAEGMGAKDLSGLIVFGREARFETAIERSLMVPRIESELTGSHTDIAAAIRLAIAAFPEAAQKRIVLLSDGNENQGLAEKAAQEASALGVPIDVVPIFYEHKNEVLVERLIVPEEAREGEAFDVKIMVDAFQDGPAVLRLFEDQALVSSQDVQLVKGKNLFQVKRKLTRKGFYNYEAVIESDLDSLYQNNRGYGYSMVAGESVVLYLERKAGTNPFLPRALDEENIRVDVRGVDEIPLSLAEYQEFDAIIIDDIPAAELTEKQMLTIESAVKDLGLGLIMVGGKDSFGAGGYQGSPIERALPVDMDLKQRKVMPNGALVLVMHTCEFANGNQWARKITKKAIRTLSARDYAGVLLYGMGGQDQWLFPLSQVRNGNRMRTLIDQMMPGDMPAFDPTLRMAWDGLKGLGASVAVKHVLIISDGDPSPPNMTMVRQMVGKDRITISTVAIGTHMRGKGVMAELARVGRGRAYEVTNPEDLPQIFVKEASVVRKSVINDGIVFQPQLVQATEVMRGFETEPFPNLFGYVATTPKGLAEIPLMAMFKKGGKPVEDPILAHWRYGLGKGVAFTSDAKNLWGADWMSWKKVSKFWGQILRWSSRSIGRDDFQTNARIEGEIGHLSLDAVDIDGNFLNFLRFKGRVTSPSLKGQDVTVTQTAPGRYETSFRADEVGTYFVNLTYTDDEGRTGLYTTGIPVSYSPEFLKLTTNDSLLHSIRDLTGGREFSLGDPRGVFQRTGLTPSRSSQDIWQTLLFAAILLFPVDVFVRRVWIPYEKIWNYLVARYQSFLGRGRGAAISSPVERLLKAKPKLKGRGLPLKRFRAREGASTDEVRPAGLVAPIKKKKETPKRSIRKEQAKPSEAEAPQNYTGRLLDAKRRAFKRRKP
ncbi:MAG: glutamine amidotransferase [Planctomycetota bacterium]|nr:glutamine amidotransferase [Planctomycetota bacterium]